MTVNPRAGTAEGPTEPTIAPATLDKLARAYIATYHGPHGDAAPTDAVTAPVDMSAAGKMMSAGLLAAHYRLGRQRKVGETLVELYPQDDPAGFGPAMQIVTDYASMLMDSVTVLLHRLGVAYTGDHEPDIAGAAQPDRGDAGHPACLGGRQLPRRRRRGLDPHSAGGVGRPEGARGGQAPAAERARRRPPGCARLAGVDRDAAWSGQRTRQRPGGALPRP